MSMSNVECRYTPASFTVRTNPVLDRRVLRVGSIHQAKKSPLHGVLRLDRTTNRLFLSRDNVCVRCGRACCDVVLSSCVPFWLCFRSLQGSSNRKVFLAFDPFARLNPPSYAKRGAFPRLRLSFAFDGGSASSWFCLTDDERRRTRDGFRTNVCLTVDVVGTTPLVLRRVLVVLKNGKSTKKTTNRKRQANFTGGTDQTRAVRKLCRTGSRSEQSNEQSLL